jgi:Toprim-like
MTWKRVSRESPCSICKKPDWCLLAEDGNAVICARVQSDRPLRKGVGWLHSVGNEPRSQWRTVQRSKPKRSSIELTELAKRCCKDLTKDKLNWLAFVLGVSPESLQLLRLGWSTDKHAYSFPMRDEAGRVVGIRYRCEISGKKFSEAGGREGMFFRPDAMADYLVIVEGASDAAAVMTVGFQSVIGRANNVGNVEQLLSVLRGHRFNRVVLVPDADKPGQRGAAALAKAMVAAELNEPEILNLPDGFKDCRAMVQRKKNARWLQSTLARLTNYHPKQLVMHEANEHE